MNSDDRPGSPITAISWRDGSNREPPVHSVEMSTRRLLATAFVLVGLFGGVLAVTRLQPVALVPSVRSEGPVLASPNTALLTTQPALPTSDPAPDPTRSTNPTSPTADAAIFPPRASGPARLAHAEFLLRVNTDRSTVDGLDRALSAAVDAQDPDAVRTAAVAILDFADAERDWLREHPPADCYALAHGSAMAMLDAYGTAADRFVTWSATGGGLAGLTELARALDAAQAAADALTTFGKTLEATSCPA